MEGQNRLELRQLTLSRLRLLSKEVRITECVGLSKYHMWTSRLGSRHGTRVMLSQCKAALRLESMQTLVSDVSASGFLEGEWKL